MNDRDELNVSATIVTDNPIFTILNGLPSGLWRGCIQHQTHIAVIGDWACKVLPMRCEYGPSMSR
jgi:hypothetical protein